MKPKDRNAVIEECAKVLDMREAGASASEKRCGKNRNWLLATLYAQTAVDMRRAAAELRALKSVKP